MFGGSVNQAAGSCAESAASHTSWRHAAPGSCTCLQHALWGRLPRQQQVTTSSSSQPDRRQTVPTAACAYLFSRPYAHLEKLLHLCQLQLHHLVLHHVWPHQQLALLRLGVLNNTCQGSTHKQTGGAWVGCTLTHWQPRHHFGLCARMLLMQMVPAATLQQAHLLLF